MKRLGLLGMLLAAAPAQATLALPISVEQMAAAADVIVRARVGEQQQILQDGRFVTLTALDVQDSVKGAAVGQQLMLFQVAAPGASVFVPGEDIVFFGKRFQNYVVSFGLGRGKFTVHWRDAQAFVAEELGDIAFVKRGPSGTLLPAAQDAGPMRLETFLQRLRAVKLVELAPPYRRARMLIPRGAP